MFIFDAKCGEMKLKELDLANKALWEIENEKILLTCFDISGAEDVFFTISTPRQLKPGGILICLAGNAEFFLDLKNYKIKAGNICVAFPHSILSVIHKSDDFKGICLAGSIELFQNIQIPSSMDYFLYIKDNPCISVSEEEQNMLIETCDLVMQKYECANHPFRMETTYSAFRMLYYEIAAIYKRGKPIAQESVPRKDMLVRKFMVLLTKNYQKNRDVDYYARELCVTPRYLSTVVKEKTGYGALFWINTTVIKQAKALLANSRLSVLQISDDLNFPNPSFFGQYFKKYTGMTPKKFRDMGKME